MNARGIYCNRTLNMRAIRAIGYDMDYTLIHYKVEAWEKRAYASITGKLPQASRPVEHLKSDATPVCRALVFDIQKGNLLKANRLGFIKKSLHGTRPLEFD